MMLLAKFALGMASTIAVAGAYTFHEGLVHVDVDEYQSGGTHLHLWAPAAMVPIAVRFVPGHQLQDAGENLKPVLPAMRKLAKELRKYPNSDFIEVVDGKDHVRIHTHDGKLQIDVQEPGQTVHVACPLSTLEDMSGELESILPGA